METTTTTTTNPPLTAFIVTYIDGTEQRKSMAPGVTLDQAREYFIGQQFTEEDDAGIETTRTAVDVKIDARTEEQCDLERIFGKPIHVVTRAQLLADGFLVDISDMARSYGIVFPAAMTRASYEAHAEWNPDIDKKGLGQSTTGRLADICAMLRHAILMARGKGDDSLVFEFYRIPRTGKGNQPKLVRLKSVVGPADDGSPCITIMELHED